MNTNGGGSGKRIGLLGVVVMMVLACTPAVATMIGVGLSQTDFQMMMETAAAIGDSFDLTTDDNVNYVGTTDDYIRGTRGGESVRIIGGKPVQIKTRGDTPASKPASKPEDLTPVQIKRDTPASKPEDLTPVQIKLVVSHILRNLDTLRAATLQINVFDIKSALDELTNGPNISERSIQRVVDDVTSQLKSTARVLSAYPMKETIKLQPAAFSQLFVGQDSSRHVECNDDDDQHDRDPFRIVHYLLEMNQRTDNSRDELTKLNRWEKAVHVLTHKNHRLSKYRALTVMDSDLGLEDYKLSVRRRWRRNDFGLTGKNTKTELRVVGIHFSDRRHCMMTISLQDVKNHIHCDVVFVRVEGAANEGDITKADIEHLAGPNGYPTALTLRFINNEPYLTSA